MLNDTAAFNSTGVAEDQVTLVGLFNQLLALLFPIWPWEPFIVMPFALEILRAKRKTGLSVGFVTIFAAVFCLAHGVGFVQAIDTVFYGGSGICACALPGAPDDIDTKAMCNMMAIHIFLMLLMGVFFARIALSPSRRVPVGGLEAVYCSRAALFFVVGGVSQGIPYWAVTFQYPERFEEFMRADGFYSARGITPGAVEFVSPLVWIVYGLYSYGELMSLVDSAGNTANDKASVGGALPPMV